MDYLNAITPMVQNLLIAFSFSMFLWKKNVLSDIAEQTFIATSLAMSLTAAAAQIRAMGLTPLTQGKFLIVVPILVGMLMYGQFFKKYMFALRWSMALVIGVGLGTVIVTSVETTILRNLMGSIMPLTIARPYDLINTLIMIAATFCTISYFIFTRPRIGILGRFQHLGRYFMMVFFGASFGAFVMTRLSMYISTINTFLKNFGIVQ